MSYLLDSNAVIALLRGDPGFIANLRRHRPQDCCISSIVAHELQFGAFKSGRPTDNLTRVDALRFAVLEFDRDDAREAGHLRAKLFAAGSSISPYAILIAGQAVCRGLTLVTHNVREFGRVTRLTVEDWEG